MVLAAGLAALCLPAGARAQGRPPMPLPPKPAEGPKAAPIPPGVPTNASNCYLPTESEVRRGRSDSVQVEKIYKLISSGPMYDRLQRVSREVVQAVQRPELIEEYKREYHLPKPGDKSLRVPFEFSFKLVDTTKEINAFALAGGPVYVTKGLMNYSVSDDELAAVLAHECTHVTFHHVEQIMREGKKAEKRQIAGMLAAIIAAAAGGGQMAQAAVGLMTAGQLVNIAAMTGYGRTLEAEADRGGVEALVDSKYNPVGMLTFMQKLARDDRLRGNPDYGIYQDHPYSNERVTTIKAQLEKLNFATDVGTLRRASGSFKVETIPSRMAGKDVTELRLNGGLLFAVAAGEGEFTQEQRAERMARQLEQLFSGNVTFNDVQQSTDHTAVVVRGVPVIHVLPEDGAVAGGVQAACDQAFRQLVKQLWKEKLDM